MPADGTAPKDGEERECCLFSSIFKGGTSIFLLVEGFESSGDLYALFSLVFSIVVDLVDTVVEEDEVNAL